MTSIPLRSVLGDLDPKQCKLHLATSDGRDQPLNVLSQYWDWWLGWNSYFPGKDEFNRRYIVSFAQVYYEPQRWLFGGVFEKKELRELADGGRIYDIEFRDDILPGFLKRLKVSYKLAARRVRWNMETLVDQIYVAEILPAEYEGAPFPGLGSINLPLAELQEIVRLQRSDWRGPLENVKGVYVIHDRATGKPYVGSAYGDVGLWARWSQYAATVHGGNKELRELVAREGAAYATRNLTFALLEWMVGTASDDEARRREGHWKDVLMSRQPFGLNAN
jgi:hypothetical protein